jgi:hypothetical protein
MCLSTRQEEGSSWVVSYENLYIQNIADRNI